MFTYAELLDHFLFFFSGPLLDASQQSHAISNTSVVLAAACEALSTPINIFSAFSEVIHAQPGVEPASV